MKFIIVGKNIEVTEGLRYAVEDKIGKLEKYFTEDTEVHVTLSVEKERQKIEVTIPVKGSIIRSEQVSNDMYVSIDLVEEIIERQLKKYKTRLTDREQGAGSFKQEYLDKDFMDEEEVKIIRSKKFDIFQNATGNEILFRYYETPGTYGSILKIDGQGGKPRRFCCPDPEQGTYAGG